MYLVSLHCALLILFSILRPSISFSNIPIIFEESATKNFDMIEKVASKQRALDVKVFRQFSIPVEQYIVDYFEKNNILLTESEALDRLMPGFNDNGEYQKHVGPGEREVQFAAICDEHNSTLNERYSMTNGVMGVVCAQIRCRNNNSSDVVTNHLSSSRVLPPHVYLANLRVDEMMRRKGIGTSLMKAVEEYASSNNINTIILSVDHDNHGAIQMYQRHGFEHVEENEGYEYGSMMKILSTTNNVRVD